MSGHTARVRAGNDRASLYTEITDKIIAELEAGRFPWVQPWGTAAIKAPPSRPILARPRRGRKRAIAAARHRRPQACIGPVRSKSGQIRLPREPPCQAA